MENNPPSLSPSQLADLINEKGGNRAPHERSVPQDGQLNPTRISEHPCYISAPQKGIDNRFYLVSMLASGNTRDL